jgi:GPH family glycoside/pentoside/hexuronide:cation symporter
MSDPLTPPTEHPDHVPLSARDGWLYGAGSLALNALGMVIMGQVLLLYQGNKDLGLPPLVPTAVLTGVFFLGRMFDAVIDPVVAWWSDRTVTRWGRRKPFIAAGALPMVVCFMLLWSPPRPTECLANGVYVLVLLWGFFFCFAVVFAPYLAMLPELTANNAERNSLSTVQAAFAVIGTLIAATYSLLFRAFAGPGAADAHRGFVGAAAVVSTISLVATLLPLFTRASAAREARAPQHFGLVEGLLGCLRLKPFRHYVATYFMLWLGLQLIVTALPQFPVARLGTSPDHNGPWATYLLAGTLLSGFACFPVIERLMRRRGRAWTWRAGMIWFAVTMPLLALARSEWTGLLVVILIGPAVGAVMILPHALLADICDLDEQLHGTRREALFFGVQGLFTKAAMAASASLATLLLHYLGNTAERSWGLVACPWAVTVAVVLAYLLFAGYHCEPERMKDTC